MASDEDHPMRLVHRLQTTGAGCEWLLDRWAELRDLLEQGMPWLAPDKLKAVRLLGRHPIDALDSRDVARMYLASHVLLNEEGEPFQEILNELSPDEAPTLRALSAACASTTRWHRKMPRRRGRCCWRSWIEPPRSWKIRRRCYRELAEINARYGRPPTVMGRHPGGRAPAAVRDDVQANVVPDVRPAAEDPQHGGRAGYRHNRSQSVAPFRPSPWATIDQPAPFVADVITPPDESPSIESPIRRTKPIRLAKMRRTKPIRMFRRPVTSAGMAHKEFRIDTPHVDRKPGGIGITGKAKSHPVLERVLTGRNSTLLNLSPIFGEQ